MRPEQTLRHRLFEFYVEHWAFGEYATWEEFRSSAHADLEKCGIEKPIAPTGSLLAENLQMVLGKIRERYSSLPRVRNVLLYLHRGAGGDTLPQKAGSGFELVLLDYSEVAVANFVRL